MFGKKKQAPQTQSRKGTALMNQMGFGGMEDDTMHGGMDDDDDDLEAELAALTGGEVKKPAAKRKAPLDMSVINKMAAESMRDIGSDEELSDTEDPDLLVS
ncbi:coiled-coil and C2 domain-containing protein 1-like [Haliotis rubra]|uniref:coiled-coil and C2 domain-containing protein 1-like n=1 Tax=Haliotis rubra TaxID=36100 RepID=UPI001EE5B48C|nr:coiled-coil and C2 domain-containing protein 1-like [Haliotis rubra]